MMILTTVLSDVRGGDRNFYLTGNRAQGSRSSLQTLFTDFETIEILKFRTIHLLISRWGLSDI